MSGTTGNQPGAPAPTTGTPPAPAPGTGTVTAPENVQPAPVQAPQAPAQPAAPQVQPATLPQLPAAPAVPVPPPTSTQVRQGDPNVDFERQYNHVRGEVMARAAEWDSWRGQAAQVHQSLSGDLAVARQQNAQLQQQLQQAQTQLQQAQTWQQTAAQAQQLAVQNDRLTRLMRYPAVLQQTVVSEQQVQGEDGQVQTIPVQSNPYVDLLMNSTLQGEEFEAAVARIAGSIPGSTPQAQPVAGLQSPLGTPMPNPAAPGVQIPQQPAQVPGQPLTMAQGIFPQAAAALQQNSWGAPTVVATPAPQPVQGPAQQIAALEAQRDDAMDSGRYNEARGLEDTIRKLKRGEQP